MLARTTLGTAALALGLAVAPGILHAQDDRLSIHGSINIAYGKTDGLPFFGLTKDGTSNYRAVALQLGYKLDENDRVVTQLLHRRIGNSPLNAVEPDFFPVWAFYEHKFDNGATVKLGRNPLPRGISNEVRFIGTLLPFFRSGAAVYGETLENIDGIVLSKPFTLGGDFGLETHLFTGGFEVKTQVPGASGNTVVNSRQETTFGTQLWLTTPIPGVRLGTYAHSFAPTPNLTLPKDLRPSRLTTMMYSADASYDRGFARGEYTSFTSNELRGGQGIDYRAWYVQGGVKPIEKLTVAIEYSSANNMTILPSPLPKVDIPVTKDLALGVTYKPSAGVAFKLEGHRNEGYQFDVAVPTLVMPSRPPLVATLAPASKAFYGIASVAVSF